MADLKIFVRESDGDVRVLKRGTLDVGTVRKLVKGYFAHGIEWGEENTEATTYYPPTVVLRVEVTE